MEHLTNTIEQTIYGYDPREFMPIFEDGQLANRSAFVAYKIKRAAGHIGHVSYKALEGTVNALDEIIQAGQ